MTMRVGVETRLLMACTGEGSAARAALREAAARVDWEGALELARAHRFGPLLAARLRADPAIAVPAPVRARLEQLYLTAAARGARLLTELRRVVDLLAAAGVESLPMRGPVLAQQLYADPHVRPSDDLDLLVPLEALARARAALVAGGYEPVRAVPADAEEGYWRAGGALMMRGREGGCELDLHGMLEPRHFAEPVLLRELKSHRMAVATDGAGEFAALEPGLLLMTLCVHGSKHGWSRHLWMADVVALMTRHGAAMDWERVLAAARGRGWQRMVLLGVTWAAWASGAELPEPVARAAAQDRALPALRRRLEAAFVADPAWVLRDDAARARLHLALMDRRRDQWRYVWRRAFTPSHNDWRAQAWPPGLRALYGVTRPWRLAYRALSSRAGGGSSGPSRRAPGPSSTHSAGS